MRTAENAFWSSVLATSAMTIAMIAFHREGGKRVWPLPPATLGRDLTPDVVASGIKSEGRQELTMLSHFGFGLLCASIYAAFKSNNKNDSTSRAIGSGILFGSGVWLTSYFGWIPAAGLRTAGPKLPARQNLMMLACHWVWGACLGYAENAFRKDDVRLLDGNRPTP